MGRNKHQEKANKKAESEELVPIFRVKPEYGTSFVKIKILGTVHKDNQHPDEQMEFETDKKMEDNYGSNILHITNVDAYTVVGKMFHCNINGSYLVNAKKLPVFYMSMIYERKFVTGFLFSIFVYFTVDEKTLKDITTPNKWINNLLAGTYTVELMADPDFMDKLTERYKKKQSKNELTEQQVDEKLTKFKNLFKPIELGRYPHRKVIINKYIKTLCLNEDLHEMIKESVYMRDENRKGGDGGNMNYTLPKRIFNMKELKDNPDKVDEMLRDEILNRESEESDFSD